MPNFYGRGEYLLWSISDADLPPLVTSTLLTPAQITALNTPVTTVVPGALGQLGTVNLVGGGQQESPEFSGGRFTLGFGNLLCRNFGLETTYFFLGQRTQGFFASSNDQPLFSPFFFPGGIPASLEIGSNVTVDYTTRLWGIEANLRKPWLCDCNQKLDIIGGFRFLELTENLSITRNCLPPDCPAPLVVFDEFGTRNRFYGGQLGLDYEYKHDRWVFGVTGKVALGASYQTVRIVGSGAADGGLLAKNTNMGRHHQDQFTVVPELGLRVGYQFTDNLTGFVGYNLLYVSDVVRPGDQVDLTIDPSGATRRPGVLFRSTDFWAYGFSAGLEWKF
jgi:hypothetical protein